MLVIPEEIKNLFRSDNKNEATRKKFKLTFYDDKFEALYPYETLFPDEGLYPSEHGEPWVVIENDRIETESLQITENLSSDEDLVFGSCEGAEMQITVADVIEDLSGREFTLTVEIGGYEMALGIYTVDKFERQSDRRKRKITAYDRMSLFNVDVADWYNDLTFPLTLKTFRDSLCDYIGVPQQDTTLPLDSMQISKTIEPEQISGLDVLQAVCEINGCFGHMDKTGRIGYIFLQRSGLYPSETLYPEEDLYPSEFGGDGSPIETISTYKQPMIYEDYMVEGITGLTIRQEEGDVGASVGEPDNVYTIEGNFLVYGKSAVDLLNIAESILPYIQGRTYKPASLDCNCMPWLEVGDALRIPTRDDLVETFLMKRTITGCQSMRDKIESTGSKRREGDFTLHKQIIQLEGKAAVITRNVEEVSVRVTDLKEYTESQFSITADAITAEVTRAQQAEAALSVRADEISASVTDLAEDTEAQFKLTSEQISLKVSKGDVSSQLSIEDDQVVISGNRLVVDSTNFQLTESGNAYFSGHINGGTISIGNGFYVDDNGNLDARNADIRGKISSSEITGSYISGGTIEGSTINIGNHFTVDSDGSTYIDGDKFAWESTYSRMSWDGQLECERIVATDASFSGDISGSTITGTSISAAEITASQISGSEIEIGPFFVDDDIVQLGDFYVSTDGSSIFQANDGSFSLSLANTPGGSVAKMEIGKTGNNTIISGGNIDASGLFYCNAVYCLETHYSYFYDIYLGKSWWGGDSITDTVQTLWDMVQDLSDETVKENITQIDSDEALKFLLEANPVTFQYKTDGKWSAGFIAQEVDEKQDELEIYYPLVGTDLKSGKYRIEYKNYIPLIISSIQNLQSQINSINSVENGENNENNNVQV